MHASTWQECSGYLPQNPNAMSTALTNAAEDIIAPNNTTSRRTCGGTIYPCGIYLSSSSRPRPPLILDDPPPPLRTPALLERRDRLQHLLEFLVPARLRAHKVVEMVDEHLARHNAAVRHHEIAYHF